MARPSAKEIEAMTETADVPQQAKVCERIAASIGPAFEGFAAVSGTLPFDLEPASFVLARALELGK
jgi:hypothetical protein